MSETPKPPEGYATWLDYVLDPGDPYKSFAGEWAAAELSALRSERDAYKAQVLEGMKVVRALMDRHGCGEDTGCEVCDEADDWAAKCEEFAK